MYCAYNFEKEGGQNDTSDSKKLIPGILKKYSLSIINQILSTRF